MRDIRIQQNPDYLITITLSRVIFGLDGVKTIGTDVIEKSSALDLAYLQEFYRKINESGGSQPSWRIEKYYGKKT